MAPVFSPVGSLHISRLSDDLHFVEDVVSVGDWPELMAIATRSGWCHATFSKGDRWTLPKDRFEGSGMVVLDFDNKDPGRQLTVAGFKERARAWGMSFLVMGTKSHRKPKISGTTILPPADRYRAVFLLERVTTDVTELESTIAKLMEIFPEADPSGKNANHSWFPSPLVLGCDEGGVPIPVSPRELSLYPYQDGIACLSGSGIETPPIDEQTEKDANKFLRLTAPAIQGEEGSNKCLRAAMVLVHDFVLDDAQAVRLLAETYNPRCVPRWSRRELVHKVRDARKKFAEHVPCYETRGVLPHDVRWTRNPWAKALFELMDRRLPTPFTDDQLNSATEEAMATMCPWPDDKRRDLVIRVISAAVIRVKRFRKLEGQGEMFDPRYRHVHAAVSVWIDGCPRDELSQDMVFDEALGYSHPGQADRKRLTRVMRSLGWELSSRRSKDGSRIYSYVRSTSSLYPYQDGIACLSGRPRGNLDSPDGSNHEKDGPGTSEGIVDRRDGPIASLPRPRDYLETVPAVRHRQGAHKPVRSDRTAGTLSSLGARGDPENSTKGRVTSPPEPLPICRKESV